MVSCISEGEALETRLRETLKRKGECSQLVRAPQPQPERVEIRDAKRATVETLDTETPFRGAEHSGLGLRRLRSGGPLDR